MGNIDFRDPNVQIAGLVVFVSLAIAYVFFFSTFLPFGYQARSESIAKLQQDYERLSADLMKAKQTASRLPQVKAEYEALSTKWEEAKELLPTEKEMADLLAQVTVAGQHSGVQFLLFEPGAPSPRDIYMENPVDVQVEGNYHQIGLFMSRTANLPRIINVNAIEMKNVPNPADPEGQDLVQATMHMAAYTLLSEEQRAAQAAAAQNAASAPKAKGGTRSGH